MYLFGVEIGGIFKMKYVCWVGFLFLFGVVGFGLWLWVFLFVNFVFEDLVVGVSVYDVEIIWDSWGVFYIYGKCDVDVVFGLVYVYVEDDFEII